MRSWIVRLLMACLLIAAPSVAEAKPRKPIKITKTREFRKPLKVKKKLAGKRQRLTKIKVRATIPNGWAAKARGSDYEVGPGGKVGRDGALVVVKQKATKLDKKAPVGVLLRQLAKKLVEKAERYRPGISKLAWRTVEQPVASRAAGGRYGRMVVRGEVLEKGKKGKKPKVVVEAYISVRQQGDHLIVVAGQWDPSRSEKFLPAADTLLSSVEVAK